MIIDQFVHQLPDTDPAETGEWLDSLDAVIDAKGTTRARYLMSKLTERARERQVGTPAEVSTPYVNTIPTAEQPWFPGDEYIEKRIRAYIRWNAAVMVVYANKKADGIGGHLSTFASSAAQYEVGFNHFFRGKDDGLPGDHVYFQGHAAPGIYARAFVEGRLDEEHLDNFRRELSGAGPGLSSYPHPWLMPDFWEFPTVSMGLGPINSIYHARFNKYLHNRRIDDTSGSRVWCFVGDGETDEPETLGSISLAGREQLDNLIWVVNCNLQRLDGPVRGNGKIIQELEAFFRGANWNVIKVIWGSAWDDLLARDNDGVLLHKMNSTVDGDFQRYAVGDGSHIRDHFFGPDPRLRQLVEHLSDEELRALPRGGHDYKKLYAAYKAATEQRGAPTVILAKTVKGWALGSDVEGRNATHQIKKMTTDQLKALRERLYMQDEVPDSAFEGDRPPYFRPAADSREYQYLMERRRVLDGALPKRVVRVRQPLSLPPDDTFAELQAGSNGQEVSTTMAFTRLLRTLARTEGFGPRVVPIIPDEARTFGMDSLFREFKIYASQGQLYEPVDSQLLLTYAESKDGQLLEEGITEAGAMSSFTAAGTAYATRSIPMVPFFIFYSMFGFQRVGDLIWAAADACNVRLPARRHGRPNNPSRRGPAAPGRPQPRARVVRADVPGLRPRLRLRDGHHHPRRSPPHVRRSRPAIRGRRLRLRRIDLLLPHALQRELRDAGSARPCRSSPCLRRVCTSSKTHLRAMDPTATILFSGTAHLAARAARDELAERYGVRCELWSATSYKALREEALSTQRWNRLHPLDEPRIPLVTSRLAESEGPIVAVTDFMKMVPDQVAPLRSRPTPVRGARYRWVRPQRHA